MVLEGSAHCRQPNLDDLMKTPHPGKRVHPRIQVGVCGRQQCQQCYLDAASKRKLPDTVSLHKHDGQEE